MIHVNVSTWRWLRRNLSGNSSQIDVTTVSTNTTWIKSESVRNEIILQYKIELFCSKYCLEIKEKPTLVSMPMQMRMPKNNADQRGENCKRDITSAYSTNATLGPAKTIGLISGWFCAKKKRFILVSYNAIPYTFDASNKVTSNSKLEQIHLNFN